MPNTSSMKNVTEETRKDSCAAFGTGAFAFLNIIATSLVLLLCLSVPFMYVAEIVNGNGTEIIDTFMWSMCIGVNLFIIIVFAFAVLLFLGMYKKKSSYVLAYFIFGVILDITLVTTIAIIHYAPIHIDVDKKVRGLFDDVTEPASKVILGMCVVYTLVLCMICRTWFLMRSRRLEDHARLIDRTTVTG